MTARISTAIAAAAGVLLAAWASAMAEPTRVRAPLSAGVATAADVVRILAPSGRPSGAGERSVYVAAGFAPGSAKLPEAAKRHLALVAEAMSAPGLEKALIVVEGHTDASGDAAHNDALSLARARSAAGHLVALGVPRSRLALRGMGETDPLSGIDPLAPEQRRIEFVRRFDAAGAEIRVGDAETGVGDAETGVADAEGQAADAEGQVAADGAACEMQSVLAAHGLRVLLAHSASHANPVFSPEGLRSVFEALEWGASDTARQLIADYYRSPADAGDGRPLRLGECSWRHDTSAGDERIHAVAMNLMLMHDGITPNPDVVRKARERVPAVELHSIPGSGFEEWLATVNLDIERSTGGRVRDALSLQPSTEFAVSNVISFEAPWLAPFDESMTEPAEFHVSGETTVTVPMMSSGKRTVLFAEDERFHRVLLPYADNDHYMHLVLPRGDGPLSGAQASTLLERADARTLGLGTTTTEFSDVPIIDWKGRAILATLHLPRFEASRELVLSDHVKEAGYSAIFTDPAAFSGLTDPSLRLDRITQNIHLRTDEAGSRVSAVTTATMSRSAFEPKVREIRFDRPFLYVVGQASSGALLAMGVVGNPAAGE